MQCTRAFGGVTVLRPGPFVSCHFFFLRERERGGDRWVEKWMVRPMMTAVRSAADDTKSPAKPIARIGSAVRAAFLLSLSLSLYLYQSREQI